MEIEASLPPAPLVTTVNASVAAPPVVAPVMVTEPAATAPPCVVSMVRVAPPLKATGPVIDTLPVLVEMLAVRAVEPEPELMLTPPEPPPVRSMALFTFTPVPPLKLAAALFPVPVMAPLTDTAAPLMKLVCAFLSASGWISIAPADASPKVTELWVAAILVYSLVASMFKRPVAPSPTPMLIAPPPVDSLITKAPAPFRAAAPLERSMASVTTVVVPVAVTVD